MDNPLQQGVAAVKSGDKVRAFQLLKQATQNNATAEHAWLWLSAVVNNDEERLFCFENALRINPGSEPAKGKAASLRQKGIFPAPPMAPALTPSSNTPVQSATSRPATPPFTASPPQPMQQNLQSQSAGVIKSLRNTPAPTAAPRPVTHQSAQPKQSLQTPPTRIVEPPRKEDGIQQDISSLYKFAAMELANKKKPQAIVKSLTSQGVTPVLANRIVTETEDAFRQAKSEKYKKRITRGLLWAIIGIVLTCGTMAFSDSMGGKYILFYGAIGYGVIDFIVGLVGWLWNK